MVKPQNIIGLIAGALVMIGTFLPMAKLSVVGDVGVDISQGSELNVDTVLFLGLGLIIAVLSIADQVKWLIPVIALMLALFGFKLYSIVSAEIKLSLGMAWVAFALSFILVIWAILIQMNEDGFTFGKQSPYKSKRKRRR